MKKQPSFNPSFPPPLVQPLFPSNSHNCYCHRNCCPSWWSVAACVASPLRPPAACSGGSGGGEPWQSQKCLAVAACKSSPPACAPQHLWGWIEAWLILLPLPLSPVTEKQSIINHHHHHYHCIHRQHTPRRWFRVAATVATTAALPPHFPTRSSKKYYVNHVWNFFQLQIDSWSLQPMCSKSICFSVCHSVCLSVWTKRGIWSKWVFMRMKGNFSFQRALREY